MPDSRQPPNLQFKKFLDAMGGRGGHLTSIFENAFGKIMRFRGREGAQHKKRLKEQAGKDPAKMKDP